MKINAEDLLDAEELAGLLGVTAPSLRAMRAQPGRYRKLDGLPDPLRTVSGRPVWARNVIERWLKSKKVAV